MRKQRKPRNSRAPRKIGGFSRVKTIIQVVKTGIEAGWSPDDYHHALDEINGTFKTPMQPRRLHLIGNAAFDAYYFGGICKDIWRDVVATEKTDGRLIDRLPNDHMIFGNLG
jgi:hypothetical protein